MVLNEPTPFEFAFGLPTDGSPRKLTGTSGHPLPGIYHVKIVIDNEVVKEYKIKV